MTSRHRENPATLLAERRPELSQAIIAHAPDALDALEALRELMTDEEFEQASSAERDFPLVAV